MNGLRLKSGGVQVESGGIEVPYIIHLFVNSSLYVCSSGVYH